MTQNVIKKKKNETEQNQPKPNVHPQVTERIVAYSRNGTLPNN